eukprot:GEMP01015737.1.p1 GENE.GEMP01015737.1~~GEMP01015737.1.p1  ORF type:complete len:530 (+),score=128.84 GEMP01015737.1:943-2532(+)
MIRVPPQWRTPRRRFPDDLCDMQRSLGGPALPPKKDSKRIGRIKQSDLARRGLARVVDETRDRSSLDDDGDFHDDFGAVISAPLVREKVAVAPMRGNSFQAANFRLGSKKLAQQLVPPERSKEEHRFGFWPGKLGGKQSSWFPNMDHADCRNDGQWILDHEKSADALSVDVRPLTTPRKQGLNIFAKGSYNTVEQLSNTVVDQFNVIHRLFYRATTTMRSAQDAEIQQVLRKVTKDLREAFEVTNNTFGYLLTTHKHLESVAENERARVAAMEEQLDIYEESFMKQANVIKEFRRAESAKDFVKVIDDKLALEKKFSEAEKLHREELWRMKDKIVKLEEQLKTESVCKQQPITVRSTDSLTQQDSVCRRDNMVDFDDIFVSKDSDPVLSAHKMSQNTVSAVDSCDRSVQRKPSIRIDDKSLKLKTLDDKLKRCKNALGLSSTSLILLRQLFGLLQCPECRNPLSAPKVGASGVTVCAACLPRYFKKQVGDNTERVFNNLLVDAMLAEFRKNLPPNVTQLVNDIQILQQE